MTEIIDTISRPVLCDRLGVGTSAITNRINIGKFPAHWFAVIEQECALRGLDCPKELFSFIRPGETTHSE